MRDKLILLAIILLQACTPTIKPAAEQGASAFSKAQANHNLTSWGWNGKAGVRYGDQSGSVSVSWFKQNTLEIDMVAPFGQGEAKLSADQSAATLLVNGQDRYNADTPDELMVYFIRQPLPVSAMNYWLLGLPVPNEAAVYTEQNDGFVQLGWLVRYSAWGKVDGYTLPTKMKISQSDQAWVKIIIKEWKLGEQ